jgi:LCP family protein required for cell wall assembly
VDKTEFLKRIGSSKLVFLLLGLDYNWTKDHNPTSEGARSDTIILITLDLYNQELRLLSIPRDLRVYYEDYGYYDKINAAITLKGPQLTKKIISQMFSIHIDNIIVIRQLAIKNLVDSVGGVYIEVEKDMYYQDNWGNLKIDLKKGKHLLNGEQVIGYMRFRMDEEGDLGRIRRQNKAIIEIMKQLPSKINSTNLLTVINSVLPYVNTDLSKEKIILLAEYAKNFSLDYKYYKLRVNPVEIEGISYVELLDNKDLIKAWYSGYQKIGILNACSKDNNQQIFDEYLKNSFYLNSSDYLDEFIPYSIIIQKEENKKNTLYYKLPFGKIFTLKSFLYSRYIDNSSEIYISNKELYAREKEKIEEFYNNNYVVLILGEDSK